MSERREKYRLYPVICVCINVELLHQSGESFSGDEIEVRKHRKIIQMIIRRMLEKDGTLLEVAVTRADGESKEGSSGPAEDKRIVLHPSDAVRAHFFAKK